jgi:hypothetical protein
LKGGVLSPLLVFSVQLQAAPRSQERSGTAANKME